MELDENVFDSGENLPISRQSSVKKRGLFRQLSRTISTVSSIVNPIIIEEDQGQANNQRAEDIDDIHLSHSQMRLRKNFVRQISNRYHTFIKCFLILAVLYVLILNFKFSSFLTNYLVLSPITSGQLFRVKILHCPVCFWDFSYCVL